jgi:hypothetical protein
MVSAMGRVLFVDGRLQTAYCGLMTTDQWRQAQWRPRRVFKVRIQNPVANGHVSARVQRLTHIDKPARPVVASPDWGFDPRKRPSPFAAGSSKSFSS